MGIQYVLYARKQIFTTKGKYCFYLISTAFVSLSPLMAASEKKDIIKRKGRGCGRKGEWGLASCCLATSLQGDVCAHVDVCVREHF